MKERDKGKWREKGTTEKGEDEGRGKGREKEGFKGQERKGK